MIVEDLLEIEPNPFKAIQPRIYLAPRPSGGTGACCIDGVCSDETEEDCLLAGGDFQGSGVPCDPDPCATGACCEDDVCTDVTEEECFGNFKGPGTSCGDVPDPCAMGACCLSAGCLNSTEEDCSGFGGEWIPDTTCEDDPSPCLGACCLIDAEVPCDDLTEWDCDDVSGGFQGVGTSCADDPNPCATGACCDRDTAACSEETVESCTDVIGGVYAGNGTDCGMGSCCPSITMTSEVVFASLSKCGFLKSGTNQYYLLHSSGYSGGMSGTVTASCTGEPFNVSWDVSFIEEFDSAVFLNPDFTCSSSVDSCTVLGHITETNDWTGDPCGVSTACQVDTDLLSSCSVPQDTPYALSQSFLSGRYYVYIPGCGRADAGLGSPFEAFDSEYTTAMLISNVEASLPAFTGTYTGGACASSRFLSSDEHTYSLQRCKPRFLFGPSLVGFTLSYQVEDTTTSAIVASYSFSFGAGTTFFDGPELFEPSTNTTHSIVNITCSVT